MASDDIKVFLDLDDSRADRQLDDFNKKATKQGQAIGSRVTSGIKRSLATLGPALAGIFAGIGLREVVDQTARFETALIGVGKTTNATDRQLQVLGDDIQALSERIPISTNELLNLGQVAGQFGVRGRDNILKFIETLGRLEVSTDLAGETGARALSRILAITGEGIERVDKLGAVFVALGNQFKTTEAQIASTATEIVRATGNFGVASSEATALSAALNELGARSESAGTAIGTVFLEIEKAISSGSENLERFARLTGLSTEQLAESFEEDAFSVFQRLIAGLNDIAKSGGSVTAQFSALGIEQKRLLRTLLPLTERTDLLNKAVEIANEEFRTGKALTEESNRAFATLGSSLERLGNAFVNLIVDLTGGLSGFQTAIDFLTESFGSLRMNLGTVREAIGRVIRTFGIFIGIVKGPAIFSFLATQIGIVTTSIRTFGASFRLNFNSAILLGQSRLKAFKSSVIATTTSVAGFNKVLRVTRGILTLGLAFAIENLITKFLSLKEEAGGLGNAFRLVILSIRRSFASLAVTIFEQLSKIQEAFPGVLKTIGVDFKGALDNARQSVFLVDQQILKFGRDVNRSIDSAANKTIEGSQLINNALATTDLQAKKSNITFKQLFDSIGNGLRAQVPTVKEFGKQFAATMVNGVTNGIKAFGAALATGGNAFEDFGSSVLKTIGQLAIQLGQFFLLIGAGLAGSGGLLPPGAGTIAAGAGLIALGGALTAIADKQSSGGAAAGGGTDPITGAPDPQISDPGFDDEDLQRRQQVAVNIQGDVLDSDETGLRIVKILEESFNGEDAQVTGTLA